jgi:hypothetical protein
MRHQDQPPAAAVVGAGEQQQRRGVVAVGGKGKQKAVAYLLQGERVPDRKRRNRNAAD